MCKLKEIYQALLDGKSIIGTNSEDTKVALQLGKEGHLRYLQYLLEQVDDDGDVEPEGWYDLTYDEDPYPLIIKAVNENHDIRMYEGDVCITEPVKDLDIFERHEDWVITFKIVLEQLLSDNIVILAQTDREFLVFRLTPEYHIELLCFHYEQDDDDIEYLDYHKITWWVDLEEQFCDDTQTLKVYTVSKNEVSTEEALTNYIQALPAL